MNRRTLLLAFAALPLTRVARAAEPGHPPTLDDALAAIARARATLKTLSGPFTQERTIGLLATKVRSTGTLTLVRPDRLRWELAPPDDVIYWITPEGLAYRSKGGPTEQARLGASQARLSAALDDLRTLLGGDLAQLRARYDITLESAAGDAVFDAVPRDPRSPVKRLRFAVTLSTALPRFCEITEGPRDATRIEFGELARDRPIDSAKMRPPG